MKSLLTLFIIAFSSLPLAAQLSTLNIHSISVNHNQEQKAVQSTIEKELALDRPVDITIFEDGKMQIIGTFEYARSGNRIKLVTFLRLIHQGNMIKSKKKKYVQFIKESVPRELSGVFADNYFIDKASLNAVDLRFKFNFNY